MVAEGRVRCWGGVLTTATLYRRLPDLQPAVPIEEIKYSPLDRDVGIVELPVKW